MKRLKDLLNWNQILLIPVLALVYLIARIPELDHFVTIDEPDWLRNSGNFYFALEEREFEHTLQLHHPGVTVTWAGALGYWLTYPAYRVEVRQYFGNNVRHNRFLNEQGHPPIEILAAARLVKVVLSAGLFLLAYWISSRLLSPAIAFFPFMLLALEPFYIGHGRLLHLDALLSDFLLLSTISFIAFLQLGRRWGYLLLSGVAAGLAFLTKVSAVYVFIVIIGLVMMDASWQRKGKMGFELLLQAIKKNFLPLFIWGLAVLAIIFALFPALWVRPIQTLVEVYELSVREAGGAHGSPMFYWGRVLDPGENEGPWFYPISYLWRSSPLTLLGLGLVVLASIKQWGLLKTREARQLILMLAWFALAFVFAINLSGTKADRYILPAYLPMGLVAGIGWVALAQRLIRLKWRGWFDKMVLAGVLVLQASLALVHFPYYLTYYNPLFGGTTAAANIFTIGSGEGLDQAARYLAAKPGSLDAQVFSWYGVGAFSFFYPGPTKFLHITSTWSADDVESLRASEYLVIYYHQWQRRIPEKLLQALSNATPQYVVRMYGLPYVSIYKVSELPAAVFDANE